jgi:hypothetical protein
VEPRDACLKVLRDAAPETLHWTVVLDRALRARLLDPFTDPDFRANVQRSLVALAKEGTIVKEGTGFYRLPDEARPDGGLPGAPSSPSSGHG